MASKKAKTAGTKRARKDFCQVVPAKDAGSARYASNGLEVFCTPADPAEVTLAEWKNILKDTGAFELVKD